MRRHNNYYTEQMRILFQVKLYTCICITIIADTFLSQRAGSQACGRRLHEFRVMHKTSTNHCTTCITEEGMPA